MCAMQGSESQAVTHLHTLPSPPPLQQTFNGCYCHHLSRTAPFVCCCFFLLSTDFPFSCHIMKYIFYFLINFKWFFILFFINLFLLIFNSLTSAGRSVLHYELELRRACLAEADTHIFHTPWKISNMQLGKQALRNLKLMLKDAGGL